MTAVEFLEMMQIKNGSLSKTDFKIAKEMEKGQIIDAIIISEKEHIIQGNVYPPQFVVDKAKKYYNETFTN